MCFGSSCQPGLHITVESISLPQRTRGNLYQNCPTCYLINENIHHYNSDSHVTGRHARVSQTTQHNRMAGALCGAMGMACLRCECGFGSLFSCIFTGASILSKCTLAITSSNVYEIFRTPESLTCPLSCACAHKQLYMSSVTSAYNFHENACVNAEMRGLESGRQAIVKVLADDECGYHGMSGKQPLRDAAIRACQSIRCSPAGSRLE
jgi:hypothetical protein